MPVSCVADMIIELNAGPSGPDSQQGRIERWVDDVNTQNGNLAKDHYEIDMGSGKLVAIAPINDPKPKIANKPELGIKFKVAYFSREDTVEPVMRTISEAEFLAQNLGISS